MKKTMKFLPMLLLVAGVLMSCNQSDRKAGTTPESTEKAAVVNITDAYVCPMNCEGSGSNLAGVCKVCGMDLVKNPNYQPATPDSTKTSVPDTAM